MADVAQMITLVAELNRATLAYDEGHPTMTDEEWDNKYFQLANMERELGVVIPESPTQQVNYEVVNELKKVEHNHKMLSLDKTKEFSVVKDFIGSHDFLAMCKMDGLTCSLKYEHGYLVSAETRGNGYIGEDILHNAKVIPSIPNRIDYLETLIIDGEIICRYEDFEQFEQEYRNPRNFAAGSIRLLDANECAKRRLNFIAWEVIQGFDNLELLSEKLIAIGKLGFFTAPFITSKGLLLDETIIDLIKIQAQNFSYPIDGIVFKFDNIVYGQAQGETAHHFKNAIAYKFYDESYPTHLLDIAWSMGRTGVLTPVAIFEPVEIEGSIVERASLHNISIMEDLLGEYPFIGQNIEVFKANMIIPQIAKSEIWDGSDFIEPIVKPMTCPICDQPVTIVNNDGVKLLVCSNSNCEGKLINRLNHFCGKKGLDIKGLSSATLEKLLNWGWIENISDIFNLTQYRNEWIKQAGFGEKSVDKILAAIENSKSPSLDKFIAALGIPLIGNSVAKEIVKHISTYPEFRDLIISHFDFSQWEGFAESKTQALWNYDYSDADYIYTLLSIPESTEELQKKCKNLNFVITGRLTEFKNRDELIAFIEQQGGKVTSAVSKNTNYLINNDVSSTSSKNLSAKKFNIPIITEQEFKEKFS